MQEKFRPIATPTKTVEIMRKYDIKMKKSLGQNFLIEPQILEKMIESAHIDKQTTVVEIGPGIGALTEYLARNAKEVFAFEIDQRFVEILKETLSDYHNINIIPQDILKINFKDTSFEKLRNANRLVVVANLPYYITTPIIMHLMNSELPFDSLVMMMQKEVAERMTAQIGTKEYNSLTIALSNQMKAELAFIVPKSVFIPKPNVDSAVLKLIRRNQPLEKVDNTEEFERFVQLAFKQRRKTIWNNYRSYFIPGVLTIEQLENVFEETEIDRQLRAEALSVHEFATLYREVKKYIKHLR